jgi:hypothetical protein
MIMTISQSLHHRRPPHQVCPVRQVPRPRRQVLRRLLKYPVKRCLSSVYLLLLHSLLLA